MGGIIAMNAYIISPPWGFCCFGRCVFAIIISPRWGWWFCDFTDIAKSLHKSIRKIFNRYGFQVMWFWDFTDIAKSLCKPIRKIFNKYGFQEMWFWDFTDTLKIIF